MNKIDYSYTNEASTGVRGCISRCSSPFVDDFGNELDYATISTGALRARSYFIYNTNYTTGIGKDDIYIV